MAVGDGCVGLPSGRTDPSITHFKMKNQLGEVDAEEGESVWEELGGKCGLLTKSHWST